MSKVFLTTHILHNCYDISADDVKLGHFSGETVAFGLCQRHAADVDKTLQNKEAKSRQWQESTEVGFTSLNQAQTHRK